MADKGEAGKTEDYDEGPKGDFGEGQNGGYGASKGTTEEGASRGKADVQQWRPADIAAHGEAKVSGKDSWDRGLSVSDQGKHM